MKASVYCKTTTQGVHNFFLLTEEGEFFLFSQRYRKGVETYFGKGVCLGEACDYSKSNHDSAVIRTMNKLPMYIKYVEKEYEIIVLNRTKRRNQAQYVKKHCCA